MNADSDPADWSLGGVWTPIPGEGEGVGEYRGDDAKKAVENLLATHHVTLESDWSEGPDAHRTVRLMIDIPADESLLIPVESFEGGSVDFAVLLAWHGLALCDRTTAEDGDHGSAICDAEREARRYSRGIHDGGFADHDRIRLSLIDIGALGESDGRSRYVAPTGSISARGAGWWTQSGQVKAIRHSPTKTIRDDGRSMGLPKDSSRRGH